MITGWVVLALPLVAAGCGDDGNGEENVLPTASASGSTTASSASTGTTMSEDDLTADTTAGGSGATFPATYLFDCIDIIEMGDSNGDGMPDGDAIQVTLLENTWASDIAAFKLNIMLTVLERDDAAGTATIVVGSGVGTSAADMCLEPTSLSPENAATFDAGSAQWQPSNAQGSCIEPATGDGFGGTYTFELSANEAIYIYAEDDDGTVFNCVPGGAAPNAVPLHAVTATVTLDANEQVAAGRLTGCLVDSEAQELCSCLGECAGAANPDCGGCPDGSVPLAVLLGDVGPTDDCTATMGETAYELTVGFVNRRLAVEQPMTCGG